MKESALGSDQKMEGWMAFKRYGVGWVAYRVDRAYSAVAFVLRVALLARWTAKCSRRMQHLASDQARGSCLQLVPDAGAAGCLRCTPTTRARPSGSQPHWSPGLCLQALRQLSSRGHLLTHSGTPYQRDMMGHQQRVISVLVANRIGQFGIAAIYFLDNQTE